MIAFDEYLKLFMETEKTEELVVGAWHRGHSRAVYEFRGQVVYCDSTCSYSARSVEALRGLPPLARALLLLRQEPRDTWWTDYCMAGRQRAERIAQDFGGRVRRRRTARRIPGVSCSQRWRRSSGSCMPVNRAN